MLDVLPLPAQASADVQAIRSYLESTPAKAIPFELVSRIENRLWQIDRWFLFLLIASLGGYITWRNLTNLAPSRKHDIESLIKQEAPYYPQVAMFTHIHPEKDSVVTKGKYAWRTRPDHWLIENKIYAGFTPNNDEVPGWQPRDGVVDAERLREALTSQLGGPISNFSALDINYRRVLAVLMAQACLDFDTAESLIKAFGLAFGKQGDLAAADKMANDVLHKHSSDRRVSSILSKHGFSTTFTHALFLRAKHNGNLPPNIFLWVKPLNRTLWYIISDCGIQRPSIETAAIRSHYEWEKGVGHAIPIPCIEPAFNGVMNYCTASGLVRESAVADGSAFLITQ
ncbi:hypothetical protein J1C54_07865 [Alcanivorax sp. 1008]|nr:hypothetical protein [Alcanivorax sp. 1008]